MSDITLVFPHQLFERHPAMAPDRPVALIEDSLLFGDDPVWPLRLHRQKIVLHRASMKAFEDSLARTGREVIYLEHDRSLGTADHLASLKKLGYDRFHVADPVDDVLERRLKRFCASGDCRLNVSDTPMFLSPRDFIDSQMAGGKRPLMARFYEAQRKRMGILLEADGGPVGGRWSFDAENRKKLPKGFAVPPEPAADSNRFVEAAIRHVEERYRDNPGSSEGFAYPVTPESASRWLDHFLEGRFARFGDYEDAISSRHRVLFHSLLTPMLNIGLLTPQQVVDRALDQASANDVPLNSLEGFIRQVIGWREFMRVVYQRYGVEMRNGNFWSFEDRPLPQAFYSGETGIPPIDDAIRRALGHGYCHHIERLMLLGNFMLLCGFHPNRVYAWFMELFVDAYDWVMVPNVYGMSQFADGGIFTTKPYISGSNYVRKMSDYPKGDWCVAWDGLFWSFIAKHESFFRGQPRLAMMAKNLDRMGAKRIGEHRDAAKRFLESLS